MPLLPLLPQYPCCPSLPAALTARACLLTTQHLQAALRSKATQRVMPGLDVFDQVHAPALVPLLVPVLASHLFLFLSTLLYSLVLPAHRSLSRHSAVVVDLPLLSAHIVSIAHLMAGVLVSHQCQGRAFIPIADIPGLAEAGWRPPTVSTMVAGKCLLCITVLCCSAGRPPGAVS